MAENSEIAKSNMNSNGNRQYGVWPAALPKHLFYFALLRICVNKEQKQLSIILILWVVSFTALSQDL